MVTHNSGNKHDENKNSSSTNKKKKPLKGISVGAPLPFFGTCEHYKNSKRWFRFDCCGRAYPCDICHELECTAPSSDIMGRKMICGYCSREQGLAQTCHFCQKNLIKKISEKTGRSAAKTKQHK
ncbi:CHY zinc finger domain-containing protein [Naegleria gruberi]|uniref:CHY zinc finger domain-containing protein n=1 Tax=Naegleria gruberi TaxID=5762 RepID=D2W4Z3_NAEGR|nr:CHY zinc finger domain-containing protein [Naegleria gruberi]EFC35858.1 CHY zinc finger domain-containing protein [Naegleria gruberi]|eukprot:XP_002668602.1 CHY zinc finger domain-containing protein [Naegleria gruberi strain NEG-M]